MPDTMTEAVLSAQDVRALKHADSLCFDHLADGTGRIRAIRSGEHTATGFEQVHVIPAELSRVQDYDPKRHDGDYTGFSMFISAQHNDIARTLVRHLRTGARFSLVWTRDNGSPVTREAHVVRDELRIQIQAKGAKVADTFLVDVQVGYDNTARMVRRA